MDFINKFSIEYSSDMYCSPDKVQVTKDSSVSDELVKLAREVLDALPDDTPPCPKVIHFQADSQFNAHTQTYASGKGIIGVDPQCRIYKKLEDISHAVGWRAHKRYLQKINRLSDEPEEIVASISKMSLRDLALTAFESIHTPKFNDESTIRVTLRHELAHLLYQGNYQIINEKDGSFLCKIRSCARSEQGKLVNLRIVTNVALLCLSGGFGILSFAYSDPIYGVAALVCSAALIFPSSRKEKILEYLYPYSDQTRFVFSGHHKLSLVHPEALNNWKDMDVSVSTYIEREADEFSAKWSTPEEIQAQRCFMKAVFVGHAVVSTLFSRRIMRHIPLIRNLCWGPYPILKQMGEKTHFELFSRLRFWNELCV